MAALINGHKTSVIGYLESLLKSLPELSISLALRIQKLTCAESGSGSSTTQSSTTMLSLKSCKSIITTSLREKTYGSILLAWLPGNSTTPLAVALTLLVLTGMAQARTWLVQTYPTPYQPLLLVGMAYTLPGTRSLIRP